MAAAESLQAVQQQPDLVTRKNTVYANSPRIAENTIVVELPHDLRTNALVQMLGLPEEEKDGGHYIKSKLHEVTGFTTLVPTFAVIAVSGLQLLMAWATFNYVRNNMILTLRNPLLTSYEMYVGSNQTLPKGLVDSLCGQYDDQVMEVGRNGPLNHISMPDGSVYKPSDEYDMFYNIKSPFRVFNYAKLGIDDRSVLDNTLYVIHEGLTFNPLGDGAGYSCLFILMMAMWLFALFIEYRHILSNATLLAHFKSDPNAEECFEVSGNGHKFRLVKMPPIGRFVLLCGILMRTLVTTLLLFTGCQLLINTTAKIDLILNALAILFVIEIDQILYYASVSGSHQRHIEDLEPIEIELPPKSLAWSVWHISANLMPIIPFLVNFTAAALLRLWQLRIFKSYFKMTAAICLFAGPMPEGMSNVVAPIAGFCDSLLGITCAPDVSPASTAVAHGHCVITDQRVATIGTTFLYLDDPELFEGRVAKSGAVNSWASWGAGNPVLYEKAIWNFGPYQDIMRKNCLQMYQTTGVPEDRLVDEDSETVMRGAPFWCSREAVWAALFSNFTEGKEAATDITMENIEMVKDLDDPAVVAAVDACHATPTIALSAHEHVKRRTPRSRRHHRRQRKLGLSDETIAVVTPEGPESVSAKEQPQEKTLHTKQQMGGPRQKKLGPAGMLQIARPLPTSQVAHADVSAEGDIS
mmetsp:Transcript_154492/g.274022  ORF Transcript_154492/g.274022 Transcript_154492/m.274022 type:complete len:694 (+) Transcript_154492:81-2162(+)